MSLRECLPCGVRWDDGQHRRQLAADWAVPWRGNPCQLIPYRRWFSENLPRGRDGVTVAGDDGCLRVFSNYDSGGWAFPIETKTNGRSLDFPTEQTFRALQAGKIGTPLVLELRGGNTPGPLKHWPEPCECGLPEPLVVAESISLNGIGIKDAEQLAYFLTYPFRFLDYLTTPEERRRVFGS